ncbi:5,10-methylenetetrahydrofolate reductase [Candidatus Hodgkinia cicadicola]|nr:5,10-methylenetetrahydrofolate reductase [Candidatus Hodgkinia cicadicola]
MYSVIQCLYNLPNADFNVSVEVFPPKSKQDFVSVTDDYLASRYNVLPKFVSLTCGAAGAAKHNSYKLLLALGSFVAAPTILVHLIQVDKSFKTIQLTACSLARLGISKLLLLRGDCYVSSQLRLDLISGFRALRKARCSSLFCATTNYPEIHSLSANARLEWDCAQAKQALGCSYSLTQFFNFAEAFAKVSVRSCLLSKLWNIPGFVVSVKRPLNCRISVKCGVYVHNFIRRLIATGCSHALMARAMFVYALAKLYSMISNNVCWLHVFVLNKFRTLRKLVWLLSFPLSA